MHLRTVSTTILAKSGYFLYTPFDEFPELVRLVSRWDFKNQAHPIGLRHDIGEPVTRASVPGVTKEHDAFPVARNGDRVVDQVSLRYQYRTLEAAW